MSVNKCLLHFSCIINIVSYLFFSIARFVWYLPFKKYLRKLHMIYFEGWCMIQYNVRQWWLRCLPMYLFIKDMITQIKFFSPCCIRLWSEFLGIKIYTCYTHTHTQKGNVRNLVFWLRDQILDGLEMLALGLCASKNISNAHWEITLI